MPLGCAREAHNNSGKLSLIIASIKKHFQGKKTFRKSLSLSVKYFPEVLVKMSGFYFGNIYCKMLLMNHCTGGYR